MTAIIFLRNSFMHLASAVVLITGANRGKQSLSTTAPAYLAAA